MQEFYPQKWRETQARQREGEKGTRPYRSDSRVAIIQELALETTNDSRMNPRFRACRTSHSSWSRYTRKTR